MNHKYCYTRCLILVLLTGLWAFPATGQQSSIASNDWVTQLIHKLQLKQDLTSAQKGITQLIDRNFFSLPEQKNKKLKKAFKKGYNKKEIISIFKDSLQKKIIPELQQKISAWFAKPSIQAVTRANQEYNTLQGKRKRVIAMYKLDQHPIEPARKQVLTKLWNTTKDISQATPVAVIIFKSMIEAFDKLNDNQHFSESRINKIVENYKTHVLLPTAQTGAKSGIHSLAVKYFNVETDDLKAYISFLKSDAGQSLITAIDKSMQAAYRSGSHRFLNLLEKSTTQ